VLFDDGDALPGQPYYYGSARPTAAAKAWAPGARRTSATGNCP
jgi:hypothetical protein